MGKNSKSIIRKQLNKIIEGKKVYPVYQPIVSLKTGEIMGYEALSRICLEPCNFNVEEMFSYAEQSCCLWNLEYLCRKKALKEIKGDLGKRKLFLNVSPNIFHDNRFKAGMTKEYLDRYHISPEQIVFEVGERTDIKEIPAFQKTILHYEKQHYQIAIDDFGKGYADLNRVCFLHPQYVKIDISLISSIDQDMVKSSLIEDFVKFCRNENIYLIAEGIETGEELKKLIELGVDYGQGFFLGKPDRKLGKIPAEIKKTIKKRSKNHVGDYLQKTEDILFPSEKEIV